MIKSMGKQPLASYAKRFKMSAAVQEPVKLVKKERSKSPARIKLPPLSQEHRIKSPLSPRRVLFKRSSIIQPIEEKSKDYENAIKDHLGLTNLSKESSEESISPKGKSRSVPKPYKKPSKSVDYSPDKELAAIQEQEAKIYESIKHAEKTTVKGLKQRIPKSMTIADKEEKEIQQIQESLKHINVLLNKILHKPPYNKQ
jgi:hypothetical protein